MAAGNKVLCIVGVTVFSTRTRSASGICPANYFLNNSWSFCTSVQGLGGFGGSRSNSDISDTASIIMSQVAASAAQQVAAFAMQQ